MTPLTMNLRYILETYHSSAHLGYACSSLTLSSLIILTNIWVFSVFVYNMMLKLNVL